MATQVYRVTRVLTAAGSPVARLQASDGDGHEARLELPAGLVERIAPGHVLVLHWSIHALPELLAPPAPATVEAIPPASAAPPATAASARTVDEAFMDLMSRGRQNTSAAPLMTTTTPAAQTRRGPEINDEFNTLLGSAPGKGSSNGR